VSDDDLFATFPGVARSEQRRLLSIVVSQRRTALADRFINSLTNDRARAHVLSACSADLVAATLPDVAHAMTTWSRLATNHASALMSYFEDVVQATPRGQRANLLVRWQSAFDPFAADDPARLLRLFSAIPESNPQLLRHLWPRLLRGSPQACADYLTAEPSRVAVVSSSGVRRHLRLLSDLPGDPIGTLARNAGARPHLLAGVLRSLPPSHRASVFAGATEGQGADNIIIEAVVLDALPESERARQATRMLQLREILEDPSRTLALTAFLPFDQALPALDAAAKRSNADERAQGFRLLVECAARSQDPGAVSTMLSSLARLRNDQDPVRLVAATALAGVRPQSFSDADVAMLRLVTDAVVLARDSSHGTRQRLKQVLLGIVSHTAVQPTRPLFTAALEFLGDLAGRQGSLHLPHLEKTLPRRAVTAFVDALLPRAVSRSQIDCDELTLALVVSLGSLGYSHVRLQAALNDVVTHAKPSVAAYAVNQWKEAHRTIRIALRRGRGSVVVWMVPPVDACPASAIPTATVIVDSQCDGADDERVDRRSQVRGTDPCSRALLRGGTASS
jgi:hypothetical protein